MFVEHRLTVDPESRLELILLKQDLIHGLLNGGEVKVRLRDDDAGVCKIHLDPEQQRRCEIRGD